MKDGVYEHLDALIALATISVTVGGTTYHLHSEPVSFILAVVYDHLILSPFGTILELIVGAMVTIGSAFIQAGTAVLDAMGAPGRVVSSNLETIAATINDALASVAGIPGGELVILALIAAVTYALIAGGRRLFRRVIV